MRYLLEGSIRPVGDRIRVSAQLIESSSGEHLWAEKYDRPATEMSDVQDDVIAEIIGTLDAQISTAELLKKV
jgi:TolB-like protein